MATRQQIAGDVLDVLEQSSLKSNVLYLPAVNLARTLYMNVDKVLKNLGGKWDRKAKGHVFAAESAVSLQDKLDGTLASGEFTSLKDYGFFPTPEPLRSELIALAGIVPGMTVLEPSAGDGSLADAAAEIVGRDHVHVVELQEDKAAKLSKRYAHCDQADFLTLDPSRQYDRVLMNPPFSKQQDIDHIRHAWNFVAPAGRLAAIASPGFTFRSNAKSVKFREFLDEIGASHHKNPDKSFRESGTDVQTVTIIMNKE